ncbi:DUF2384 domain-containing protein [Porphyrobacter algicida]|uniref:DUF2384 domain-containing protein n=1 Tax=Qipengyuania algicida TaxID=1836209 RepID=A0A845AL81_9SPHN|nr:DUF2384 domain-containing protein [Qipengyuania algicida]MXP29641.1 DUF2384 domain-containing protein [Qipengyuania algicida]
MAETDANNGSTTDRASSATMRAFEGLSRVWSMTSQEQWKVLGLGSATELAALRNLPMKDVPTEITLRVRYLLEIFEAINTLVPRRDYAAAWMRAPNTAAVCAGRSALEVMIEGNGEAIAKMRDYLLAELQGP